MNERERLIQKLERREPLNQADRLRCIAYLQLRAGQASVSRADGRSVEEAERLAAGDGR